MLTMSQYIGNLNRETDTTKKNQMDIQSWKKMTMKNDYWNKMTT